MKRRVPRRTHPRGDPARRQRLSAADLALVLPPGLPARPARQVPADGAEQGPLGLHRLPLRGGCRMSTGTPRGERSHDTAKVRLGGPPDETNIRLGGPPDETNVRLGGPPDEANVRLGGLLGEALEANRRGRLSHFIVDETSPAIAIFAPQQRRQNHEGDWYGEHAGKWLIAAAKAAARSGDAGLRARLLRVADFLV